MLQRDTGIPASEWVCIENSADALAFNLAMTYELARFDAEAQKTQAQMIAYEVSKMFGGKDDVLDDQYINAATEKW